MKNKFSFGGIVFVAAIILCGNVAEAGFWGRLFGKEEKKAAVEAAVGQGEAVAAQGKSEGLTGGLDVQSALATAQNVKDALSSIAGNGEQLRALLADKPDLLSLLDKALNAAKKGDDLLALDSIKEISEAASLSAEQSKLVDGLKKDFEILALGRNFPEDGPVSDAIAQLKGGDYSKALSTLGDMAKDSNLTQQQRSILNKVIQQYAGDLKRLLPF